MQGPDVYVNTLVMLLAIFAGGILWGMAGMILFVPFVGIAKLIADHNPKWKTISMILGMENEKKPMKINKIWLEKHPMPFRSSLQLTVDLVKMRFHFDFWFTFSISTDEFKHQNVSSFWTRLRRKTDRS